MARTSRSKDVRIAEIDVKIEKYKTLIEQLESKKSSIINPAPRTRKPGVNAIIKQAKELGMTADEIAKKLGIKVG
ncbi:hypothetical protein SDC9_46828 [bioreactor metagenome]|uniref:Uncharacterized protein n=1 Tax=bioreactor metagenome TaxID=1076179 RepID=A0A644WAU8_9ZZZZ